MIQADAADRWVLLTVGAAVVLVFGPLFAVLGMPRADSMAAFHRVGLVGPTCGLTRGVVAVFRGEVGRAWAFNPASLLVVLAAVGGAIRAIVGLTGHGWVAVRMRWSRRSTLVVLLATGLLWANQQAHAGFILHHLS